MHMVTLVTESSWEAIPLNTMHEIERDDKEVPSDTTNVAEWYLFMSLILSTFAGAIVASVHLVRIKRATHLLWIWPMSMISLIIASVEIAGHDRWTGVIVLWIAELVIYLFLKRTSKGITVSKVAVVLSVIFFIVQLIVIFN